MPIKNGQAVPLKQLIQWSAEAQLAHQEWRAESWEDYQFRDGKQWSQADLLRMEKKGIRALTINRIFPILNLLQGHFLNNQPQVVAKGRTKKDNELGQVMSEAIKYIGDQCQGPIHKKKAFEQQVTSGIGFLGTGYNPDPRKENVHFYPLNWYSVWWDPYSTPWMPKESCRYGFTAEWSDIDDLVMLFPEKEKEIRDQFSQLGVDDFVPDLIDEGTQVEELRRYVGGGSWANAERKRVRPIEMWYTAIQKSFFAKMPNGRVIDLDTLQSPNEEYEVIQRATEVVTANVKKMRVSTFLGNLSLQDVPSPYAHDDFPFVPYVGYLDRYDRPFGVPRQIKEQDSEVNKRRSMALSLLSSRRVTTEEGASADPNKTYTEANRQDGFIVMGKGKMDRIKIEEMGALAPAQMSMLEASEKEIQEVAGSNDVVPRPNVRSTGMMESQQATAATITASLLDNAKMSDRILGEKLMALIQDTWTDEKVLRVTDRVTGAEKFIALNERFVDDTGIQVRNDITQARFDLVIGTAPMTDTIREKNMEVIFAAVNKAPPEAIGPLVNLALEISDIPEKEQTLAQIRTATGMSNFDNLTTEEREAKEQEEAAAKAEQDQIEQGMTNKASELELDKEAAEIAKIRAETQVELQKVAIEKQDVDQKGFQIGQQSAQMMRNNETEGKTRSEESHSKNPKPKGPNNDKGITK